MASRFEDDVSPEKENYRIMLMGSYDEGCIDRLYKLKNELQKSDYKNTKLARDLDDSPELEKLSFEDPTQYPFEKSMYGIEWSAIILFVFFKDCRYDSMITEMHESIESFNKVRCIEFLIEVGADLRDVNSGYMQKNNLRKKWFVDDDDLYQSAKSKCWIHLIDNDCN